MSDTLLTTVQDFCAENSLPIPAGVCGVVETGVVQYRAIMKRLVTELSQYNWKEQLVRGTFTTIAAEDQGLLTTLIGPDCQGIIQDSIWNESMKRPFVGPVPAAVWEQLKALPVTGPLDRYAIHANHFRIIPTPPAGEIVGLMYKSSYGVMSAGGVMKQNFTQDDDTIIFPDVVVAKGLAYMWKKTKGEEWQTLFSEYMGLIAKNIVKDTDAVLYMDKSQQNLRPGIWVPAGSWGI